MSKYKRKPRQRAAGSPVLNIAITEEARRQAIESNSGGCLIADAIKAQYPHLTDVSVDMALIRVTDREKGERYEYNTPPAAQHVLLLFDQGWANPVERLTIKRASRVTPIVVPKGRNRDRAARLAELEEKERTGTTTAAERRSLTIMRRTPERPSTRGAAIITSEGGRPVVRGGYGSVVGANLPNLLRGRNRFFGAKLANPGSAFQAAVDQAVAQRLAEMGDPPT